MALFDTLAQRLSLNLIDREHREQSRAAFLNGDVIAFLEPCENDFRLGLLKDNIAALKARGIYEAGLIHAYCHSGVDVHLENKEGMEYLFLSADRAKLRELSSPLPRKPRLTIFRGVAGSRGVKRALGFSWTLDKAKAAAFAARWRQHGDPAVYRATIAKADVWAYLNQNGEKEVLCLPERCKRDDRIEVPPSRGVAGNIE